MSVLGGAACRLSPLNIFVFVRTGDRTSTRYLGKGAFLCAFWTASGGKASRGIGVSGSKASDWFGERQGVKWFVKFSGGASEGDV